MLEVHSLKSKVFLLLHFLVPLNFFLETFDLFLFFADLIGELNAPDLLELVDLFFVHFDL